MLESDGKLSHASFLASHGQASTAFSGTYTAHRMPHNPTTSAKTGITSLFIGTDGDGVVDRPCFERWGEDDMPLSTAVTAVGAFSGHTAAPATLSCVRRSRVPFGGFRLEP